MNAYTSPLQSVDLLGLFHKHRGLILTGTFLSVAVFVLAAFTLPKQYKASFVLTIYSNYFQNPLTRDITPEIFDSSEMRAQREALIRQALTPEFIDSLGEKYGIYASKKPSWIQRFTGFLGKKYGVYLSTEEMRTRSEERKGLLKRIQVNNLTSDSFQVSFLYSKPEVTYQVTQDLYRQMTEGLLAVRRNNLLAVREAIQKRLEALAIRLPALDKGMGGSSSQTMESQRPTSYPQIDEELAEVRNQLRILTPRYTEEHPMILELRERERTLSALAGSSGAGTKSSSGRPLAVRVPQDAAEEIFRELTKKLNYLTVALDSDQAEGSDYFATLESPLYPSSPLWPRKSLFLLWGLGIGILGSLFLAAIREYFERTALRTPALSEQLGVPMLGEIPMVRWGAAYPSALRGATTLTKPTPTHN